MKLSDAKKKTTYKKPQTSYYHERRPSTEALHDETGDFTRAFDQGTGRLDIPSKGTSESNFKTIEPNRKTLENYAATDKQSVKDKRKSNSLAPVADRAPNMQHMGPKFIKQQNHMTRQNIKRDIVTAAAAMRMGYSSCNRNDLMNTAYLPSKEDAQRVGFEPPNARQEPAFRIYAKNSATKEVQELQYKHRNRAKLSKLAEPLNSQAEKDIMSRSKNAHISP